MNRQAKIILITLFSILCINDIKAQSNFNEITDKFFEIYNQSPQEAIEYIFSTNKWMVERNKDGIDNMKTRLASSLGLLGDYYGFERITEKSVGESFVLVSYMIKYDRQPIRFTFIFYKPVDKWQIQNFQFDDNLDDELEEAGKIYLLQENW